MLPSPARQLQWVSLPPGQNPSTLAEASETRVLRKPQPPEHPGQSGPEPLHQSPRLNSPQIRIGATEEVHMDFFLLE
jgi:hypothetical protein